MPFSFKLEDKVTFISHDDTIWGKEYGGKLATIKEIEAFEDAQELKIQFEDGQELVAMSYECLLFKDESNEL